MRGPPIVGGPNERGPRHSTCHRPRTTVRLRWNLFRKGWSCLFGLAGFFALIRAFGIPTFPTFFRRRVVIAGV